ncbi:MAG TPA: hypothetical protein PLI95_00595, partial [Polyangiaceae bacterium]|nr:hypothetical protein [Polyangiaceae bacterium]
GGAAGEAGAAGTAGAAGAGACAIVIGVPACDECINTSCSSECNTCAQNAECVAIFECVTGTCVSDAGQADMTCAMGCVTSHTAGMNDFFKFWQGTQPGCVSKNCATPCAQ